MTSLFEKIAALVHRESGVKLSQSRHGALNAAIGRAAPGTDPGTFLKLASDPMTSRETVDRLIDEVTVKETSFLRDRQQLEVIDWNALLKGAWGRGRSTVRAWSVGCATGEEPYTLALLASESFAPLPPPVWILGTDISGAALAHARAGEYRRRKVRALAPDLIDRYLEPEGDRLVVADALQRLVAFARHNVVRDPVPPPGVEPFDLVLCRNVLIYFDAPTAERVAALLKGALAPGGTLVLGAADALCVNGVGPGSAARLAERANSPASRPHTTGTHSRKAPEHQFGGGAGPAGDGEPKDAMEEVAQLLAEDPMSARAHFIKGLVELEAGEAAAAVTSLRRAIYLQPTFALAAFKLGRAYDLLGQYAAARRAYEQALRTIEPERDVDDTLMEQVDLGDVAVACRTRIESLR